MAEYSKQITSRAYRSFFTKYIGSVKAIRLSPMLVIRGDKEESGIKAFLKLLATNPCRNAVRLHRADHSFPMRNAKELNPILEKFISECA